MGAHVLLCEYIGGCKGESSKERGGERERESEEQGEFDDVPISP